MPTIRFPDVRVRLTGRDGNAIAVVACISRALREARVPSRDIDALRAEVLSGDYEKVLRTALSWVTIA